MSRRSENNFKKAVNELMGYQDEAPEVKIDRRSQNPPQPQPYAEEIKEKTEYVRQPEIPPIKTIAQFESTIAEDMEIAGNISSKNDLNIYGRVSGSVCCSGEVVLIGSVGSDVTAVDIVIRGSITGNVTATGRAVVEAGGWVKGDIIARNIITEGTTEGDMKAEDIVVIKGSSTVTGNVYAKMFEVHSGSRVKGFIHTYD